MAKLQDKLIFSSKANVLNLLKTKIKKSRIEKMYYFTHKEWKNNKGDILKKITKNFSSNVVIRSSAVGEDSIEESKAGFFESYLDISAKSKKQLQNSINKIIYSYKKNGYENLDNQILVQTQTNNVKVSGVVFTRVPESGAPYYVINYDRKSTTTITSGIANNMLKIFKNTEIKNIPKKWKPLILAIKELEKFLRIDYLDIEFAINKNNDVIIFQVRTLTTVSHNNSLDSKIAKKIIQNKNKFLNLNKKSQVTGIQTFFSDMADWNPSEIIGTNPNLLDYSLYDYLVMKDSWQKGRLLLDYQNVSPHQLMVNFGSKPYVDLRASFNSLIPNNFPKSLIKKLIKYYFQKISSHPELHDKIEFNILFTCYDLSVKNRLKDLKKYDFTQTEINKIESLLLDFTRNILLNFEKIFLDSEESIKLLTKKREYSLNKLKKNNSFKDFLIIAESLLVDCKNLGVIPFSTMARITFIGLALLKSIQSENKIHSNFSNIFMKSIKTPLSDIRDDTFLFLNKKISKKEFLKKYGHLRPGTYDITVPTYNKKNEFLQDVNIKKPKIKNIIKSSEKEKINRLIEKIFNLNEFDFLESCKMAIIQREKLKFEFTKNLSISLDLITNSGKEIGFSKEDLSNLDISTIFKHKTMTRNHLNRYWKKKISSEENRKKINNHLNLPPILFDESNFEVFEYFISEPNYITSDNIKGEIVVLKNDRISYKKIENKIILLENADPGYDWIFTRNPKGLITKYGGIASHMSVRCSEIGLPAAIGCGDMLYNKLLFSKKISLECRKKQIFIIDQTKPDDYIEEKKLLKTLGYIK